MSTQNSKQRTIAAVVLTYNNGPDLPECLLGLLLQKGVNLKIIVVDNASTRQSRAAMFKAFQHAIPNGIVHNVAELSADHWAIKARGVFVINDVNAGYSAGNNIGARLGVAAGCDAVLIINPDVRIHNPHYIEMLANAVFSRPDNALAASSMVNLSGVNENPMQELGFWEEFFWPIWMLLNFVGLQRPTRPKCGDGEVEKISGSCFLARSDFLQQIGFFDEGVFLYCEESILAVQLKSHGKKIAYLPKLEAVHAHVASAKGDPVERIVAWTISRRYFHKYAGLGPIQRGALYVSQNGVIALARLRQHFASGGNT